MQSDRPILIWKRPLRWIALQFNTPLDLFEHLDAVAAWLDEARRTVVVPLMATYDPASVRTSIRPHDSIEGAPEGLLVTSGGWSTKGRPLFGAGDERGWKRKLEQLARRDMRETELRATAFGPSGRSFDGPGEVYVTAVLRDQFTANTAAPLPAEHPAQLKVWARRGLLKRIPSFDPEKVFRDLGKLAIDTMPDGHAFLELERPLSGHDPAVPVSPLAWTSPVGAVDFDPASVEYRDPPSRHD